MWQSCLSFKMTLQIVDTIFSCLSAILPEDHTKGILGTQERGKTLEILPALMYRSEEGDLAEGTHPSSSAKWWLSWTRTQANSCLPVQGGLWEGQVKAIISHTRYSK